MKDLLQRIANATAQDNPPNETITFIASELKAAGILPRKTFPNPTIRYWPEDTQFLGEHLDSPESKRIDNMYVTVIAPDGSKQEITITGLEIEVDDLVNDNDAACAVMDTFAQFYPGAVSVAYTPNSPTEHVTLPGYIDAACVYIGEDMSVGIRPIVVEIHGLRFARADKRQVERFRKAMKDLFELIYAENAVVCFEHDGPSHDPIDDMHGQTPSIYDLYRDIFPEDSGETRTASIV